MFWDPLFEHVSELSGSPPSQIKLITTLLVSYPLASLYVHLAGTSANLCHLFSLGVSYIYLVPLLGLHTGFWHLVLSCLGVYLIVVSIRGPHMPWVAFFFAMGHLLYNHTTNFIYGVPATEIEITFTQMVLVMNLTTFAWNVHDGRRKVEELDVGQKATRLQHVPSPLPFFGYCFFFPAMLIGPSVDYATYDSLVTGTIFKTAPPGTGAEQEKAAKRRTPYGRRRVAYLHFVIGLAFLGVYAVYGGRGSYARILGPDWATWGVLTKFGFVQFAGFIARTKYYAVWSLSEGACILTGIGFNGYDPRTGRTLWNRVRNVNIVSIETAESFKVVFDSWNCRTNVWLRDCIYKRLVKKDKKPGSLQSMATFVTSAIWHGIAPGYYLAFVTAGLYTSLGRQIRRFVRPYFLPASKTTTSSPSPNSLPKYPYPNLAKRAYDVAGWFVVQTTLNYVACAFMLLSFKDCVTAWNRMGWYGHVLIALAMVFFQAGGRRRLRKGIKQEDKTVPSVRVSPPSPPEDETDPKDLRWVKHALDNPGYQDAGEGVHPDGGIVDRWMDGAETPVFEKPRPKEL